MPGIRQGYQHLEYLADGLRQIHNLMLLLDRLRPGHSQQLLGQPGQAVGFVADIGDKLPHNFGVHIVLQNAVRQQLDGRKGRLQLMGRI